MLEIRNVTKIYRTKGGADAKALNDVSIKFEDKGLVFLLGKSGSGKSTLLNVAGGLDEPTSGEVIVMGKSSKDFSGSDFDSYRNTFVGFIFQEYNVLNEFNVEDNIALALELQGKPKDREKITKILQDVELEQFAKRKPNTLSGGQKQRIAIARALVKDPQIIMADEPTGALDSVTGKQVFDTLKKLAQTRLVVVVSHDREFAEIYGDRIIELMDGKIISDVVKTTLPPEQLSENVSVIGENTLSIKSGAALTAANFKQIQQFVAASQGDVIITKGDREVSAFKKANRIDASGARETFRDTDEKELRIKTYQKDDVKFIRSRLPAHKAIKIGASGLKVKPVRLVFTIFLSLIAFVLFGLFSTLMFYDGDAVKQNSLLESNYDYLLLKKQYQVTTTYHYGDDTDTYTHGEEAKFTPAELKSFGSDAVGGFRLSSNSLGNIQVENKYSVYYNVSISKALVVPAGNALRDKITNGSYPANENEIAISSYLLDCIKNSVFTPFDSEGKQGAQVTVTSASQVIGTYLKLSSASGEKPLKIVGIFDSGTIPAKYDNLKENADKANWLTTMGYENYLKENLHQCAFVSENFYEKHRNLINDYYNSVWVEYFSSCEEFRINYSDTNYSNFYAAKPYDGTDTKGLPAHFFATAKNTLDTYEIIVSPDEISTAISQKVNATVDAMRPQLDTLYNECWALYQQQENKSYEYNNARNELLGIDENSEPDRYEEVSARVDALQYELEQLTEQVSAKQTQYDELNASINAQYEITNGLWEICRTVSGFAYDQDEEAGTGKERPATKAEIDAAVAKLKKIVNDNQFTFSVTVDKDGLQLGTYTIVGFYQGDPNVTYSSGIYCSQTLFDSVKRHEEQNSYTTTTKYEQEADAIYSSIYLPFDKTQSGYQALMAIVGVEHINTATDVYYELDNSLVESVRMANETIDTLSTVFLAVGAAMAVFAALLLFNFIAVSISSKRKDIGILRAVGARGVDVFKIFFSESAIIVGIATALSIIGTVVLTFVINNLLKTSAGLDVTLFVFGWISLVFMIGVAVVVAFISTFLPVYFAAKKKPVDSIRAL